MEDKKKREFDITVVRDSSIYAYGLMNIHKEYQFYYDETNNSRVFKFRQSTNKFNHDLDANFILGGIVHESNKRTINNKILLDKLNLQKNLNEIKFKHICSNGFLENLKSNKLEVLLQWLDENNIFIHFSNFDNLYWGFVDVIDWLDCNKSRSSIDAMKAILYKYLKKDINFIYNLLSKSEYPNISEFELGNFYNTIINWLDKLVETADKYDINLINVLIKELKNIKNVNNIECKQKEKENILVKDYSPLYLNKIFLFINSKHCFDIEKEIIKKIDNLQLVYKGKSISNYEFKDSKSELYIQLSDVIVGLLGNLFEFLNKNSWNDITNDIKQLKDKALNESKDRQFNNLKLFIKIINKSNTENKAFIHHTCSIDAVEKFNKLLELNYSVE